LGPIVSGPDHVLVTEELATILGEFSGSDLHFESVVIFDPARNLTLTSYREVRGSRTVAPEAFATPQTLSGNAWLVGNSLVVSAQISKAILALPISGVRFSSTTLLQELG
jgi:hypothetical protein